MLTSLTFEIPSLEDGMAVHELVGQCPPLDMNSSYCNILQCSHFAQTSVAAKSGKDLLGFVSGYLLPNDNSTLFIWQVAVSQRARGQGLASRMISEILQRSFCSEVNFIETTITETNEASWSLFRSVAQKLGAPMNHSVWLDEKKHFQGKHDTEMLVRIGPFTITDTGE